VDHLVVRHGVAEVLDRGMRQVIPELGPEGFDRDLDLGDGRRHAHDDLALLVGELSLELLVVGREVEQVDRPVTIVNGRDELVSPRVEVRLARHLFVEQGRPCLDGRHELCRGKLCGHDGSIHLHDGSPKSEKGRGVEKAPLYGATLSVCTARFEVSRQLSTR
jgi:hypothetical protein